MSIKQKPNLSLYIWSTIANTDRKRQKERKILSQKGEEIKILR